MAVVMGLLLANMPGAQAGGAAYVALGDSVAAGTGNPVITPGDPCLRSTVAYPFQVASLKSLSVTNLACSGASAYNGILSRQNTGIGSTVPAQLGQQGSLTDPPNPAYDAARPAWVSLTDGANELQFGSWLLLCYAPLTDCSPLLPTASLAMPFVYISVRAILTEIRSRGIAVGQIPTVLLTTYFDPLGSGYRVCPDTNPAPQLQSGLTPKEVDGLRQKLGELNATIRRSAVGFPNVRVVELQDVLAGHELCTADPWVLGLSSSAPFHPNAAGQMAIAARIAASM